MTPERQAAVAIVILMALAGCGGSSTDASGGSAPGSAGSAAAPSQDGGGGAADAPPQDPGPPAGACTLAGPPSTSSSDDVLVWSDEFDGTSLDTTKWTARSGYLGHDDIMNVTSPAAVSVHDGSLFVVSQPDESDPAHPYVSGRIDTRGLFARTFGRVEMRARFSYTPGCWYAFWSRPWSDALPEIDVEILNRNGGQIYFVNHWDLPPIPADERRSFALIQSVDYTQFHLYSVVWKPGSVEWRLDDQPYMTSTDKGVPKDPIQWVVNGWVGGWSGPPTAATQFPANYEMDYVRVYRHEGVLADPAVRIVNPQTKYSSRLDQIQVQPANFDEACFHVRMYDGDALVQTLTSPPFAFDLSRMKTGAHTLRFEATDGARTTSVSLPTETY